ncbi:MAG: ATP-binding protein [Candidatus Sericytochromatia bacterium]
MRARLAELEQERDRARQDAELLRLSFTQAPVQIAVLSGPGLVYTFVNAAYRQVIGDRPLIGLSVYEALPELAGQGIFELLERVYATGEPSVGREVPVQVRRSPGGPLEEGYFTFTYQAVKDDAGAIVGVASYGLEITKEVRARQGVEQLVEARTDELALQQDLTARIIDHAPAGIAYLDTELIFRWVNPTFGRLLGIPSERMVGRYLLDLVPEAAAVIAPITRRVIETGEPYHGEAFPFVYTLDGEERTTYWDWVAVAVPGRDGRTAGVLVMDTEISHRVETERLQREKIEALEQADRLKDQFLGILSHELRTPINAIMGFGSILDDGLFGPLNADQHACLTKLLGGAERLLGLVNDVLNMSQIQAGTFQLLPAPMRLSEVAVSSVSALEPLAQTKRQRLVEAVPADLPPLTADAQRLAQVLTNLIGNAIKFTPEGGTITVSAALDGRQVRCRIADTGPGIADADQARLFMPFTQLDMSHTRAAGGVGLGLSICRALVEAHGGRIGVDSEPGRGSTFWFTLPIEAEQP